MKLKVLKNGVVKNIRKVVYAVEGGQTDNTIVSIGSKSFIGDSKGNVISGGYTRIIDIRYGITVAMKADEVVILNKKGDEIKKGLDHARIEKKCIVFSENGKLGIMNFKFKVILEPSCSFISKFINGFALYSVGVDSKYDKDPWGVISEKGDIVVPPIYKLLIARENKLIACNSLGMYGCIDFNENIIAPFKFDKIQMSNGKLRIYNSTEEYIA